MTRDGARGHLIVFEGPDGVGKTTLAQTLVDELNRRDAQYEYYSFPGRDQGTLGHLVYELHHKPDKFGIDHVEPASLQVLHVAAHLDAISRRILPALEAGQTVILDRFWWSTVVYGMVGGVNRGVLDSMVELELQGWGGVSPDAAFLVSRQNPLRIEGSEERWRQLRDAYVELAQEQADRHPVHTLVNEGTPYEALTQMLEVVEGENGAEAGPFRRT